MDLSRRWEVRTVTVDHTSIIPANVLVTFPHKDDDVFQEEPYTITVSLSSLSLQQFQTGFAGDSYRTRHFNTDTVAESEDGNDPDNLTELTNLANQIATDYYLWLLADLQKVFASSVPYDPEGLHDIEWSLGDRWTTTVRRGPWFDLHDYCRSIYGTGGSNRDETGNYLAYRYYCQNGDLNEYQITLASDESVISSVFTRTIACCDDDCAEPKWYCMESPDTGSGSGTGGGSGSVEVDCCPSNAIAETLDVAVSGKTGDCTCWPDSFQLVWNASSSQWEADVDACVADPADMEVRLSCGMGGTDCNGFDLSITQCGIAQASPDSCVCDTFQLVFNLTLSSCCTGDVTLTITEA